MSEERFACLVSGELQPPPSPVCSRLRVACAEWLYPVRGYCTLGGAHGRLMIPSIAEFQNYCTTSRFDQCPWFGFRRDGRVSVEAASGALSTSDATASTATASPK